MSKYLFYPGCSLQRNARAYLDSTEAIREDINIVLEEIQDWNCCRNFEGTGNARWLNIGNYTRKKKIS